MTHRFEVDWSLRGIRLEDAVFEGFRENFRAVRSFIPHCGPEMGARMPISMEPIDLLHPGICRDCRSPSIARAISSRTPSSLLLQTSTSRASSIPDLELVKLPDLDHWVPQRRPDLVASAIRSFFETRLGHVPPLDVEVPSQPAPY